MTADLTFIADVRVVQGPAEPVPAADEVVGHLSYDWCDPFGKLLIPAGPVTRSGHEVLMSYLSAAADYLDVASWWRWNETSPDMLSGDADAVQRVSQAIGHAYSTMVLLRFGWYSVLTSTTENMTPPVCPADTAREVARLVQNAVALVTLYPFLAGHIDRALYMAMCALVADERIAEKQ